MYVVYFRAYIILRAHATLRRGALLFLATFATFAAWFLSKPLFMLLPYLLPFCPFSTFAAVCAVPFAVPFALKRFQRSFYAVFRAVLSGLIVWRVHLHRLHRFVRLNSLICGKFAVLGEYRGAPPKPKRREAQLRSHRILIFPKKFFPKIPLVSFLMPFEIFFLENSLSPSASCLPFQCQNPLFP